MEVRFYVANVVKILMIQQKENYMKRQAQLSIP